MAFNRGHCSMPCQILDISEGGAQVMAERHTSMPERICPEAGHRRAAQLRGRLAKRDHHRCAVRLMNTLQVIPSIPITMTQHEAAFHSSAEEYRQRANLIRCAIEVTTGTAERTKLMEEAAKLEQLAAVLEQMRSQPQASGLVMLMRRNRYSSGFR